jgi:hypothetical protein
MIPMMNIIAWSASAPWAEIRQVEQDLIISRALIELFGNPMLAHELRFRGGTALHMLSPDRAGLLTEDAIRRAFVAVFMRLISIMPGASWAKTSAMKKKFGIA